MRFGVECQYEIPHWVNNSLNHENACVKTSVASNQKYQQKSREELYEEIELLKSRLDKSNNVSPKSLPTPMNNSVLSQSDFGEHNNDVIDLYESYNALSMKNSSHEEHTPLNPMAYHKKDHYTAFFVCYMFLTIRATTSSICEKFKSTWKSNHSDGASKWLLLLDLKYQDSELQESIQRIINDRAKLYEANTSPFLRLADSNPENVEGLIKTIEQVLPSKVLCENYLDFFFHFMSILRPFVDEDTFKKDVARIISFDDVTLKPKVKFSERRDCAIVATFLIIIRYASIAVSVIDEEELPTFLIPLKENPVSVKAIPVAQMCLSIYKVLRKSTIHILQALLYLRMYFKDCPEDGDGLTLIQSQQLFGFIVQSALAMGLHRDPVNYSQISNDVKESNLRRRIWYSIVNIDTETSILAGSLSVLPDPSLVNVKPPMKTSVDSIENAQAEDLEKSTELNQIWQNFCNEVNNMQEKPTLSTLVGTLERARKFVETNYSMKDMISCKEMNCGSRIFRSSMFKNVKILEKNLLQLSLELSFYVGLTIHYESNAHLNADLYKIFFKKSLENLVSALDIAGAYLAGAFNDYFRSVYTNFTLLPLLNTTIYRASNIVVGSLLRAYHAQELLNSKFYSSKSNVSSEEFEKLINPLCKRYEDFMFIYKKRLGTKYYQSLKMTGAGKYSFVALKKNKFTIMNKIIKYLESNEKGQINEDLFLNGSKTREEIKKTFQSNKSLIRVYAEWMQLSNSSKWENGNRITKEKDDDKPSEEPATIININNSNMLLEFTKEEIHEYSDILINAFRFCSFPKNTNMDASKELLQEHTTCSTPSELYNEEFYDKIFHDSDFDSQMSRLFKASKGIAPGNDYTASDGVFGEIFDQLMGSSTATVDDILKFQF